VTHVVNYECPEDEKAYLHRIGRTGRAGREGVAVTFVDWNDLQRWRTINAALNLDFADPIETYSTSDHLFAALTIPAGATGVLPTAQRDRLGLEAESLEDIGETGKSRFRGRSRASDKQPASGRNARSDRQDHGGSGTQGTRTQRNRRRTRAGQPADRSAAGHGSASREATEDGQEVRGRTDGAQRRRRQAGRRGSRQSAGSGRDISRGQPAERSAAAG
jgi:superfamily II DNA/RNA helicase